MRLLTTLMRYPSELLKDCERRIRQDISLGSPMALELMEARTLLSGASLDPTFGDAGLVLTDIAGGKDEAYSMALVDGKILVAGRATMPGGNVDFLLVRYNADGSLDTSFGGGDGFVTVDLGSTSDLASAMAVQSDGKIVLVGQSGNDFGIVRLNADGSLDTSFGGGDGIVTTDFAGYGDRATAVAIQSDGKIVAAGVATVSKRYYFAIARYNADGTLDTTFDTDGKATVKFMDGTYVSDAQAFSVAIQSDGKIVLAGTSFSWRKYGNDFALARLNVNGSLDTTFGSGGMAVANTGFTDDALYSIQLLSNGILVAGEGAGDMAVMRYTYAGLRDTTFGTNGMMLIDFNGGSDGARQIILDEQGRMLLAGYSTYMSDASFALVRLTADGTLDEDFAPGGKVTTNFSASGECIQAEISADGKVIVAGWSDFDIALARYSLVAVNAPPAADAGSVYTVVEGASVMLSAANSADLDGTIVSYEWDFNYDGVNFDADANGVDVMFSAAGLNGPSQVMVAVRITDDQGVSQIATAIVSITNAAPVANAGADVAVVEGNKVTLVGSWTDAGAGESYSFLWQVVSSNGQVVADWTGQTLMFTPVDDGTYTITFTVNDGQGGVGSDTVVVTVANAAPVAEAGADLMINEGQTALLTGTYVDAGRLDTHSVSWTVYDGAGNVVGGGSGSYAFAGPDDGVYTAVMTVTDDDGGVATDSMQIQVNNVAPMAEAGEDQVAVEGSAASFHGMGADVAADSLSYSWTVMDAAGAVVAQGDGQDFEFTSLDDGLYTLVLKVMDDDGGVASDSAMLVVANADPVVAAGSAAEVVEGSELSMSAAFTDAGVLDTHSILWQVYDAQGQLVATSTDATFSFGAADDGQYTVVCTVSDDDGGSGSASVMVSVTNAAPVVNLGGNTSVNEGSIVMMAGSYSDAGSMDTHSAAWQVFGSDGAVVAEGQGLTISFAAPDDGIYTVVMTVVDDDGGMGSDSVTVNVANVAPTADAGADQTVTEGTSIRLAAGFTDPGAMDSHSFLWQVVSSNGQVVADGNGESFSFTPADNGTYVVTLTVMDDDGGSSSDTMTVNVLNAAPRAAVAGPASAVPGQSRDYTGGYTDAGWLDTHEVMWDFGDGTVISFHSAADPGALNVSHTWVTAGRYNVTMLIRDKDGAITSAVESVDVRVVDLQQDPVDASKWALFVGGTSFNDSIVFQNSSGGVAVFVNNVYQGVFNPTGRLIAFGQTGDDTITAGGLYNPVEFYGGAGDDVLRGGKGDDLLVGGDGSDQMIGGGGDDMIITDAYDKGGGAGNRKTGVLGKLSNKKFLLAA